MRNINIKSREVSVDVSNCPVRVKTGNFYVCDPKAGDMILMSCQILREDGKCKNGFE